VRIGVVADTHVGEQLPALPGAVVRALEGVDLILHAGDLSVPAVLDDLRAIAPVVAVRGNHDRRVRGLPRDVVVRVGDRRIGLTHGARGRAVELPAAAVSLVAGRPVLLGFDRAMRRRFGDVDLIVTGHLHMPFVRTAGGVPRFSPGAVYVAEDDPGYDWSGPRAAGYRRFRAGMPPEARIPSIGLIDVDADGVRPRVVPLGTVRPPARVMRPPRSA
jgi:hypothetical protein